MILDLKPLPLPRPLTFEHALALAQSTVSPALPSKETNESKTGCNCALATILCAPLTIPFLSLALLFQLALPGFGKIRKVCNINPWTKARNLQSAHIWRAQKVSKSGLTPMTGLASVRLSFAALQPVAHVHQPKNNVCMHPL